jgi:O-antigen ligase
MLEAVDRIWTDEPAGAPAEDLDTVADAIFDAVDELDGKPARNPPQAGEDESLADVSQGMLDALDRLWGDPEAESDPNVNNVADAILEAMDGLQAPEAREPAVAAREARPSPPPAPAGEGSRRPALAALRESFLQYVDPGRLREAGDLTDPDHRPDTTLEKATLGLTLAMTFVLPWENAVTVEGLGTISRMVGLLLAGCWGLQVLLVGGIRQVRAFHVLVGAFVLWNATTYLWSADPKDTLQRVVTYLQLLVLVHILWDTLRTEAKVRMTMQAYVLGCYVSAYQMVVNFRSLGSHAGEERMTLEGFNTNDIALILALGMPVAWYLTLPRDDGSYPPFLLRMLNWGLIPAATLSVMLTASRGATGCMLLAFAYMLLTLSKLKQSTRLAIIGAVWAMGLMLIPLIPESSFERLSATGDEFAEGDLNGRAAIWLEARDIFFRHPIVGVGAGAFKAAAVETAQSPHNIVVSLATESGLVGLALFLGLLAAASWNALLQPKLLMRLWGTVLLIWLMGALTHNWEWRKQTWYFLSLIVACGAALEKPAERRDPLTDGPFSES